MWEFQIDATEAFMLGLLPGFLVGWLFAMIQTFGDNR